MKLEEIELDETCYLISNKEILLLFDIIDYQEKVIERKIGIIDTLVKRDYK